MQHGIVEKTEKTTTTSSGRLGESYGSVESGCGDISSDDKTSVPLWSLRMLCGLVFALCGGVCAEGYDVGVLNGALVRIQDAFGFSSFRIATIVSITPFCVMPGSLLGGWAADQFGRRLALFGTVIFLIIGPLIMAFAFDFTTLVVGRGIVGGAIGSGLVVVNMYLAEITPTHLRGQCVTFQEVAFNVGMLFGYIVNWSLVGIKDDWRYMLGIGCFLPMPLLLTLIGRCMPESPRWLAMHNRQQEAAEVLEKYSGVPDASNAIAAWTSDESGKLTPWSKLLCPTGDVPLQRKLIAGISLGVAQAACGYLPIAYYSSKVMKRVMDEKSAFLNTMIMGIIKTIFVFIAIGLIERFGRRPLLLASTGSCAMGCLVISVAFVTNLSGWYLAAGFWIFMAGFSVGLGPVTFVYIAEIYPTEMRAKAMGLVLFLSRSVGTAGTLVFPLLTDGIGVPSTFGLLVVINVGLFFLIWAFARETYGMHLEEMHKVFV